MAYSKVVKLEDFSRFPGSHQNAHLISSLDRSKTNQTVLSELLLYGTDSSFLNRQEAEVLSVLENDKDEEKLDKVPSLPDNWPKVPQIFCQRSCEMTNTSAPCVNKVVAHLQLLQYVIENWCTENQTEMIDRQSTDPVQKPHKEDLKPFLGAEGVIDEVMTLLARLENERQEIEKALEREKARDIRLNAIIDDLRKQRLIQLQTIIQREHKESGVDHCELQWHVAYSSRNETKLKDKWNIVALLNKRLTNDIAFLKRHIPLVQEKLAMELRGIEKIDNAQKEKNDECAMTKVRLIMTESKYKEALQKATLERGHIQNEVQKVRDALKCFNYELSLARATFKSYRQEVVDTEQQLILNDQEIKVLEVKNENCKAAKELLTIKVKDLEAKVVGAESECTRLEVENDKLLTHLDGWTKFYTDRIRDLELAIIDYDNSLCQTDRRNQELEMEMQDLSDKIAKCKQQKIQDEKNIRRMLMEIQKIMLQLRVTEEELSHISIIYQNTKEQLHLEQDQTNKLEASLKLTLDGIKKLFKDEQDSKRMLNNNIESVSLDLEKFKLELGEKSDKIHKVVDKVMTARNQIKEKVGKLQATKDATIQKMHDLLAQMENLEKQIEDTEMKFKDKMGLMQPQHNHLKETLDGVSTRLDHMTWKTDMMINSMKDMDKSQGMMDHLLTTTSVVVVSLIEQLTELLIQVDVLQKIDEDLKFQYADVESRIRNNEIQHRKFLEDRNMKLKEVEDEKQISLKINTELASKYRALQHVQMVIKENVMNKFDTRLKMEGDIRDLRELQSLQSVMHIIMMRYYTCRGLFNLVKLSSLEYSSVENSDQVTHLHASINTALQNIKEFLQVQQMTSDAIRKLAMNKEEAKIGVIQVLTEQKFSQLVKSSSSMKVTVDIK